MTDQPHMSNELRDRHNIEHVRRFISRELRRFNLSHRQQTIAEVILDLSLGWGKRSVKIPRLSCFTGITGITPGNVSTALSQLHDMRILDVQLINDAAVYTINVDSDTWQVAPRVSRMRIRQELEMIKPHNGLTETPDPDFEKAKESLKTFLTGDKEKPANFKNGLDSHFLGAEVFDSGMKPTSGVPETMIDFKALK